MRHSYGGGIYFLNSKGEINNTLFESNEACSTAKFTDFAMTCEGGSICFKKSEFNITNNIFSNNLISVPKEFSRPKLSGAAIFANESSILNIYNCDFFNNKINNYGLVFSFTCRNKGGSISSENCEINIDRCNFSNNFLYKDSPNDSSGYLEGGAIDFDSCNSTINNSLFLNNSILQILMNKPNNLILQILMNKPNNLILQL